MGLPKNLVLHLNRHALQDVAVHALERSVTMVNEINRTLMHVKYDRIQNTIHVFL